MGLSLVEILRHHAARSPDAPCLSFEADRLTFRELNDRSSRVANALLQRGVRRGDRVAVIARNAPVHFELFFGCAKAAAIMLPINSVSSALRFSGRFIQTVLTGPSFSMMTLFMPFTPVRCLRP